MKRKGIYIIGCLLLIGSVIGCEDMDENYKQYLKEYNYSSKVDSLRCHLGFERVALAWELPKDQKAKRILIEYGVDKQQKVFDHLIDTIVIDGLDAGTGYDFAVYTLDNADNRSVPATISAIPISQTVVDNLVPPTCTFRTVDGTPSVVWTGLSAVSMSYCKHSYIDYKVTEAESGATVKEGRIENEYADEGSALNAVSEYTLPLPELQSGFSYYVDFTAYVYPISSNIVTMDSVPVSARSRIFAE